MNRGELYLDPNLPYFTADLPPLGGSIKSRYEDFVVEEVPLFEPGGEGEHLYISVTKRGITTTEASERLAKALKVHPAAVSFAGLKDRKAVTTQTFSVHLQGETNIKELRFNNMTVNWAQRHRHKLKAGKLRGNKFKIALRGVKNPSRELVKEALERTGRSGFPNYFGAQRFGSRRDNHLTGGALLRKRYEEALSYVLGRPDASEKEEVFSARSAYDAGRYQEALSLLPASFKIEKKALNYLVRSGPCFKEAAKRLPKRTRRLFISAFQSFLFNKALAERIRSGGFDQLLTGDIALKHDSGACFRVEDAEAERERFEKFEISPTGPVFGTKMLKPELVEGRMEEGILEGEGLTHEDFTSGFSGLKLHGARRSYRQAMENLSWELEGDTLFLEFFLPKGVYATCALRELTKPERPETQQG